MAAPVSDPERVVPTTCAHNCGGRCLINAHVSAGQVVRITTDHRPWDPVEPPLHACARGFAMLDRHHHPDRLLYPMRRVGARGEGRFARISWDEALDETARRMLDIRDRYGPAAIMDISRTGSLTVLHSRFVARRLLNMFGGHTELWGSLSNEAEIFAHRMMFGVSSMEAGREGLDYRNSRLIIVWGWNPDGMSFNTNTNHYLRWAREAGTRIVTVDPRLTITAKQLSDRHYFIRPTTDAAMLIAMAYEIYTRGLHDQAYLDRYTTGFDEAHLPPGAPPGSSYVSYLLGERDGVPKTAAWAAAITGVPEADIIELAIEYATTKPASLNLGYGPGRSAAGEEFHRAGIALAATVGMIGVPGGGASSPVGAKSPRIGRLPVLENPTGSRVNSMHMTDAILRGRAGGYPSDIKMVFSICGNLLNQLPNVNRAAEAFKTLDFILVAEHFMTPTARFADILLPAADSLERDDIHTTWVSFGHYAIFMNKAVDPPGECRTDLDWCTDLARRLGIEGFNPHSDLDWLRAFVADSEIDDFERFRREGVARVPPPQHLIAFREHILDPDGNPFKTPTGKIELYSTQLAARPNYYGYGEIPPIPTYRPAPETRADQATLARYPLSMITPKSRARTHSTHANQPRLAKIEPQRCQINPTDAAARGIRNGDLVRVFNDRGETILPAWVSEQIVQGAVAIPDGAWFTPDGEGRDLGGSPNVLTLDEPSRGGSPAYVHALVEVALA